MPREGGGRAGAGAELAARRAGPARGRSAGPLGGGRGRDPVEVLARGLFRFCKLALSDTDVYWGDAVLASVFAVPKAGGPARLVAGAWSLGSVDLGFHRDALWVLQGNGVLERIDLATGDIAMGRGHVGIVLDEADLLASMKP